MSRNLYKCLFVILILFGLTLKGETNHKIPLFMSVVLPGGGQMYNHKYIKAGIYAGLELVFIYGAVIQNARLEDARDAIDKLEVELYPNYEKIYEYEFLVDRYKKERNNFIWLSIGTILLSAGDAYVDSYFSEFKRSLIIKNDILSLSVIGSGLKLTYSW